MIRKRLEEIFGSANTVGAFRKTRYRGRQRTWTSGYFVAAAYDLTRMVRPLRGSPAPPPLAGGLTAASEAGMNSFFRVQEPHGEWSGSKAAKFQQPANWASPRPRRCRHPRCQPSRRPGCRRIAPRTAQHQPPSSGKSGYGRMRR
jgi:hypothetical protein